MRKSTPLQLLGLALVVAAPCAHAQWYVGASAGESRTSSKGGSQADQLLDLGFDDASSSVDDKDTAYRIHAGYQFHRYLAVEAGYVDLGRTSIHSTVQPTGSLDTRIKAKGFDLSAVGMLPLGEQFMVFARIGAFAAETRASFSGSGSVALSSGEETQKKRTTGAVYGIGATYNFTPQLALRAEWNRYQKIGNDLTGGEFDAKTLTAGIQYRF